MKGVFSFAFLGVRGGGGVLTRSPVKPFETVTVIMGTTKMDLTAYTFSGYLTHLFC